MKKIFNIGIVSLLLTTATISCNQKKFTEVIEPDAIPQIIVMDDEEGGEEEDSDEASFKLTLADKIDPTGKELGGKIIPLKGNATVNFKVTNLEGFATINQYILNAEASYEVNDCNDEDTPITFNTATGEGSVTFPANVEEIEVKLGLNEDLFDDNVVNDDDRGFKVKIVSITNTSEPVIANTDVVFEYKVLDNEVVFTKWEIDVNDDLNDFKALFGVLDGDIADLKASDIDKVEFQFGLNELEIEIELNETETNDCGDVKQKKIEIEAEYDDLTDDATSGDIKIIVEVEDDNGVKEYEYEGTFDISNGKMTLVLKIDDIERILVLSL